MCEGGWIPTFGGVSGVTGPGAVSTRCALVHDDGSGPALYVGGRFTWANGVEVNGIARWDGTAWSAVGSGLAGTVRALTVYDDGLGAGPLLYAGGEFTKTGDGTVVNNIARWDGALWQPVGPGFALPVNALVGYEDPVFGRRLYAGGEFQFLGDGFGPFFQIARWDGSVWSGLGPFGEQGCCGLSGGPVHDLAVFDDGSGIGPLLYVAGTFQGAFNLPFQIQQAKGLARFDGANWSDAGANFTWFPTINTGSVYAIKVVDGTQTEEAALYVAGGFRYIDESPGERVARWTLKDGWVAIGTGIGGTDDTVHAIEVFDEGFGSGPQVFVGGSFEVAEGGTVDRLARWTGSGWQTVGGGPDEIVQGLGSVELQGGTPQLIVMGSFNSAGPLPASRIAAWDGESWSTLGAGLSDGVRTLSFFDDGGPDGPALYAGGAFTHFGSEAVGRLARWDGERWHEVGSPNSTVLSLVPVDDPECGDASLLVAGSFTTIGDLPAKRVARFDGSTWSTFGSGLDQNGTAGIVYTLALFDDGLGVGACDAPALAAEHEVGGRPGGPSLYAGGIFNNSNGTVVNRIARWDGTQWHPVGGGITSTSTSMVVYTMVSFDDGSGPALYVGGNFSSVGPSPGIPGTIGIARWDGTAWSSVGGGLSNGDVRALAVFDDGTGPALYVGGTFTSAGGQTLNRIARWDGAQWTPLLVGANNGVNAAVYGLAVSNDDGAPSLYAVGEFTSTGVGGTSILRVGKWNGVQWSSLAPGFPGGQSQVVSTAIIRTNDAGDRSVYIGGTFQRSPAGDARISLWRECAPMPPHVFGDLNGDGVVDGADLGILLNQWGKRGLGDLDGSGVVDAADLGLLLAAWGI